MENLQTAAMYLLRYGGMHPIKTANRISISLGLLLWTIFLQVMLQLANVYYLMFTTKFSTLNGFLTYAWDIAFVLSSILIPIHFFCHADKIFAVNSKLDEIIKICSMNNLKMSIESKFRIFLVMLMRIIVTFLIVFLQIIGEEIDYIKIFVRVNTNVINAIVYLIFATYLTILTEYFRIDEARIADHFDRIRSSTNYISVAKIEDFDEMPINPPLGVDTSRLAQQSLYRQYNINAINVLPGPSSRPCDSTSKQLCRRSLQTQDQTASTQTHDFDENMEDFFQKLDRIHNSISEVQNIYNLCISILGFPMLQSTIWSTIGLSGGAYAIYLMTGVSNACCFVPLVLLQIATLLNTALLTTFPSNLDQKASNSYVVYIYIYIAIGA